MERKIEVVKLGSIVTVYDLKEEEEASYKIVEVLETGRDGEISMDCPFAKALLGKFAGVLEVETPDGKNKVKILNVDNSSVENNERIKQQAETLRKIIEKTEREKQIEEEKKQQAKNLSGYYLTHPCQGGGCSGK